jgi:Regulator of chromosome condensation (RCC1) repeat
MLGWAVRDCTKTAVVLLLFCGACSRWDEPERTTHGHADERAPFPAAPDDTDADAEVAGSKADSSVDAGGPKSPPRATDVATAPVPDAGLHGPGCQASRVVVGKSHACAISLDGAIRCWGDNSFRQVGSETATSRCGSRANPCEPDAVRVEGIEDVVDLALTDVHTCGLRADGSVWCWGSGVGFGLELPGEDCDYFNRPGKIACTHAPTQFEMLPPALDIDGWGERSVLARDGTIMSWGSSGTLTPTLVANASDGVAIDNACVLDSQGVVSCWKRGGSGYGAPVAWNWDGAAQSLSRGYSQVCAVTLQNELYCWGLDIISDSGGADCVGCTPELIAGTGRVAQVSAGLEVTWFRDEQGAVRMIDTSKRISDPLSLPAPAVDISAGYHGACAVLESHDVYCWLNPTSTLSDFAAQGVVGQYQGIELTTEPRPVDLCP